MQIRVGTLRRLIFEVAKPELVESFDDRDYEINVEHDKVFDLPGGEHYIASGYERSQLRAKVTDEALVIVYMHVAQSQQGGGLAMKMLQKAAAHARAKGLKLLSSGVYSQISKSLLAIFERRGLVKSVDGYHEFDLTRL
jgi:GNAT superfamily N-acetyltransferase